MTRKDVLCFDLLLGHNAIKALCGIIIKRAGTIQFLEAPVCAILRVDQLDFKVEFDRSQKIWIASWKETDDDAPTKQ